MKQDEQERERVAKAQSLRALKQIFQENWPHELEIIGIKLKLCKAKFDAARREGFSHADALHLCTRNIEI